MSDKKVKVVGLCGSLSDNSTTRKALQLALKGAEQIGAETKVIDLRKLDLPFCDGTKNMAERFPDVGILSNEVKSAQGIILATPEYHGSFSGVLKNAMDLMGFDEFEGKMMGLIGVSGGTMGGLYALNTLRLIGRSLHAWVVPEQVAIPEAWKAFDENGEAKNQKLGERLTSVGKNVARFAFLHSAQQSKEFIEAWEEAPSNPGG
jgi:FMN reductase